MLKQTRSLLGGKAPAPTDPREHFAGEVERSLRSIAGVTQVKRVPDSFAFDLVTSSGDRRVYLDNAFAETREMSPEQRRERIAEFFAALAEDPSETWDVARDLLVPVLRGATYGIELWVEKPGAEFLRRPFLPHLDVVVAIDRASAMSFVGRGIAEGWEVEDREVFEAANARVPLLADPSVELYDDTHGPLWIVTSNDSYESSRLLVPGWLASFRGKVEGSPIAIVPDRAMLMVGGDARPEMVERLIDKAEREFGASNRRLSPALYGVDSVGSVIPYARPAGDPLAAKVKIASESLAIYEHQNQKEVLEELYEKNGPDVFVASYSLFQAEGSSLPRSVSVWSQGLRTYLPRTEKVVLLVVSPEEGAKPTAQVEVSFEAIEGRLTLVPGLHPARYETTGEFPGEAELRRMGEGK